MIRKKAAGLCLEKHCRRKARKQRTRCNTCASRRWRAANPIHYLWINLRHHAKQRGHAFTITRAEWAAFCKRTKYHEEKGRDPDSLTVERKNENQGYHFWNITVLRHAENRRRSYVKYFAHAGIDYAKEPWENPL